MPSFFLVTADSHCNVTFYSFVLAHNMLGFYLDCMKRELVNMLAMDKCNTPADEEFLGHGSWLTTHSVFIGR